MPELVEFKVGLWLDGSLDTRVGREVELLSLLLPRTVFDAVLALRLFEQAMSSPTGAEAREARRYRDGEALRLREGELAAENGLDVTSPERGNQWMRLAEHARRDVVRAKWEAGELPSEYESRLPVLHAHSFLSSLMKVRRTLVRLSELETGSARAEIQAAVDDFVAALPGLKGVRDTAEHADERILGRDRRGRTMTLAPISSPGFNAPTGNALVIDMLAGRTIGSTAHDGTYHEVEVSDATIEGARAAVQRALDALPWRRDHGYPVYLPRA
jgi:hypothetical protein